MGNAYQAVNELIVELARVKEERDRYREALIALFHADRALYCDENDVYHVCECCLNMQIQAEHALRGGEE